MSERERPHARSSIFATPRGRIAISVSTEWHGSVNGHAQAVIVIASESTSKPGQHCAEERRTEC